MTEIRILKHQWPPSCARLEEDIAGRVGVWKSGSVPPLPIVRFCTPIYDFLRFLALGVSARTYPPAATWKRYSPRAISSSMDARLG